MFNVGGGELLVIALIALIVLGPDRLPEAARTIGKVMGDIRRLSTGFQDEVRHAFDDDGNAPPAATTPASSPLAAEVAELDRGDLDADDRTPLRAIEATATEVSGAGGPRDTPRDAPTAEVAPDVAAALGEALGEGEHRAAS
jgi:sec-independent protein translocase protein TatB